MRKVLVFKETILPPSETFVLAQASALKRYQPMLVGLERSHPTLLLQEKPLLLTDRVSGIASLRAKLYRRTGFAPIFHKKAKQFRPDLVHAHFASGGRTAMALAHSLKVPLLVTLHGSDVTVRGPKPDIYKRLAEQASLFICVSEFIRDRALEAGFPSEKLLVHYIGIDCELFQTSSSQERSKRILFIGRLVEKKGCEYLLHAMQFIQVAHPDCELSIIGDGPLRSELEDLAKDLNVRCNFFGTQPATIVREALQRSRLLCVPSVTAANGDSEGLPTVIAEAQAVGLPVVASAHAGIPEIVSNGNTGILTPERDSMALAKAMSQLLADEEMWQSFHYAAVQRILQHFDLKKQTSLLEDIYTRFASTS
jgi:colanic acid/amylovoran biosynthesis glycosyltransferase